MAKFVLGPEGARKFRELCASRSAGGRRDGGVPASVFAADFAAPFTVQWASSLAQPESSEGAGDGTSGEWIIWLPGGGSLLTVSGEAVDITSDLTAAGGKYPTGWYKLGSALDRSSGGTLYLNVTKGSTVTAEFAASAGSGSAMTPLKIAVAAIDSTTGARSVKQLVTSAIVMGGDSRLKEPFHYLVTTSGETTTRTVAAGSFFFDGVERTIASPLTMTGSGSETAYLLCYKRYGTWGFSLSLTPRSASSLAASDEASISVKLYDFVDGEIVMDYRGQNLPVVSAAVVHPKPFRYVVESSSSGVTRKVMGGTFYFNGTAVTVSSALAIIGSGDESVYLNGSTSGGSNAFTFTLSLTPSSVAGTISMKLYDFVDGVVTNDLRDTFLTVPVPAYGKTDFKTLYLGAGSGNPVELGKIVALQNATILQKTLVEGSGISITESADGKTLTISATGGGGGSSTSGYTTPSGSEDVTIAAMKYDTTNHQMLVKYCRETYENGLLKTRAVDSAWSLIEGGQAVAETV